MSDRRTQGAMLLLVGATALWLGLTDAALAYVRGGLRPALAAGGLTLLGLAAVALLGRDPGGHEHGHGQPDRGLSGRGRGRRPAAGSAPVAVGPRSGWLLALPVLVLLLVAPPALGSFAAGRQGSQVGQAGTEPVGAFPPLAEPVGGAVPLAISEFVGRALYDERRSLAGTRVRLLGFAAPDPAGGYLLTRFNLFCCAADGQAYQVVVRGDPTPRPADQWLVVEGRWRPRPVSRAIAPSSVRPVLVADSVATVRPPADPYEHNLFGL